MAEIDVLLSMASRAPSVWLNRVRRHLMSSASMPVSRFFDESGLLMLCRALPSTAWPLSEMNVCSHLSSTR